MVHALLLGVAIGSTIMLVVLAVAALFGTAIVMGFWESLLRNRREVAHEVIVLLLTVVVSAAGWIGEATTHAGKAAWLLDTVRTATTVVIAAATLTSLFGISILLESVLGVTKDDQAKNEAA